MARRRVKTYKQFLASIRENVGLTPAECNCNIRHSTFDGYYFLFEVQEEGREKPGLCIICYYPNHKELPWVGFGYYEDPDKPGMISGDTYNLRGKGITEILRDPPPL